jgi:hypothetical protein
VTKVTSIVRCPTRPHRLTISTCPVVTSDPGDLARLADSIGVKIRLFAT